jgi:fatty acid desaturase
MSEYLNPVQREKVSQLLAGSMARTEWPTWLALIVVYAAWVGAIYFHAFLGPVLTSLLLVLVCAWYMSIQHELVHGHPTRIRWLNKLLGFAPLAIWFPYTLYAESHLRHHNDNNLTLPDVDPETHYVSGRRWDTSGPVMRMLYTARKSFWGRFFFGPALALVPTWLEAIEQPVKGKFRYVAMWATHLALVIAMLAAVERYAGISPLHYVFGIAYPALSLAMVRSYYEHRAADHCKHRIVINEAAWPMRLLYLNNNYHLVHHDLPSLPWYLLPQVYRANRDEYIARCDGFLVPGYMSLMWRFGFRTVDAPVHPFGKVQTRQ